ncbi:hypothetical protein Y1Q_0022840 [Alligator mississippiensis]|uniref:Uncharacterized protein n=1 Tax=Alligator mississippiensis TaxID=8496 RepID=A0A151N5A0_ALLMI|nr:hypothetical protein Y1Q_0022840 [Alligator mississippiensis]
MKARTPEFSCLPVTQVSLFNSSPEGNEGHKLVHGEANGKALTNFLDIAVDPEDPKQGTLSDQADQPEPSTTAATRAATRS